MANIVAGFRRKRRIFGMTTSISKASAICHVEPELRLLSRYRRQPYGKTVHTVVSSAFSGPTSNRNGLAMEARDRN
jgi:hypothetical protein